MLCGHRFSTVPQMGNCKKVKQKPRAIITKSFSSGTSNLWTSNGSRTLLQPSATHYHVLCHLVLWSFTTTLTHSVATMSNHLDLITSPAFEIGKLLLNFHPSLKKSDNARTDRSSNFASTKTEARTLWNLRLPTHICTLNLEGLCVNPFSSFFATLVSSSWTEDAEAAGKYCNSTKCRAGFEVENLELLRTKNLHGRLQKDLKQTPFKPPFEKLHKTPFVKSLPSKPLKPLQIELLRFPKSRSQGT